MPARVRFEGAGAQPLAPELPVPRRANMRRCGLQSFTKGLSMHLIRTGALVLVLGMGLGACGSDGESGATLKRAELVTKANAICAAAKAEAGAVKAPPSITDPEAASAYFDKIAPITDKETEDLKALEPDDAAKADWDAFVSKQDAANELLKTITAKAKARDQSGLKDLENAQGVSQAVVSAATKLGATVCAS